MRLKAFKTMFYCDQALAPDRTPALSAYWTSGYLAKVSIAATQWWFLQNDLNSSQHEGLASLQRKQTRRESVHESRLTVKARRRKSVTWLGRTHKSITHMRPSELRRKQRDSQLAGTSPSLHCLMVRPLVYSNRNFAEACRTSSFLFSFLFFFFSFCSLTSAAKLNLKKVSTPTQSSLEIAKHQLTSKVSSTKVCTAKRGQQVDKFNVTKQNTRKQKQSLNKNIKSGKSYNYSIAFVLENIALHREVGLKISTLGPRAVALHQKATTTVAVKYFLLVVSLPTAGSVTNLSAANRICG